MAILMIVELPGVTPVTYQSINESMGIHGDDDAPEGLVSHLASATDDGMLVIDVWESKEALDGFVGERLAPALAAAGVEAVQPRVLDVHRLIAQGAGTAANVVLIIEAPDFTTETCDRVVELIPAHSGDGSAHPAVSHVAARAGEGMVFVDVWDSPEGFGAFAEEQLAPVAAQVDMPELTPRFLPIHRRLRGRVPARI